MASSDSEFRRGIAGCLGGIGAILFGIALELAGSGLGPVYAPGLAFFGLAVAIAGAVSGAIGVAQIERAARSVAA